MKWLAVLAFTVAVIAAYGWRYGYSALPAVVPKDASPASVSLAPDELTATNVWHWVRALTRANVWRRDGQGGSPRVWSRGRRETTGNPNGGLLPRETLEPLLNWLASRPAIDMCMTGAVAAVDRRPPADLKGDDVVAFRLLASATRWRAAEAAHREDTLEALRHLLKAWRLQTTVAPSVGFASFFDERGGREVEDELARPFRQLVLTGPSLPREESQALIRELAAIAQNAVGPETAFLRNLTRSPTGLRDLNRPDWRKVRRSLRMAFLLMRQDMNRLLMDVFESMLGRRRNYPPNYHGAAHVFRPLRELSLALQTALIRAEDSERVYRAALERALELMRRRQPVMAASPSDAPSLNWWRRWIDRPAAWRALDLLPDPQEFLRSWQEWHVYLESCRLTLALRAFRDARGDWPDRLEALAPDFIDALPVDPLTGGSFDYRREGAGWVLSAGGSPDGKQDDAKPAASARPWFAIRSETETIR